MSDTKQSKITIKTVPHPAPEKGLNILVNLALKELKLMAEREKTS